jgi:hypothetical protein
MTAGLSFESFAAVIGVNRDTLYAWCDAHSEFSDAKKRGDAASLLWWEKIGKAAMIGQAMTTHDGKLISFNNFNATIWIFNMKNRHGWRDRREEIQVMQDRDESLLEKTKPVPIKTLLKLAKGE